MKASAQVPLSDVVNAVIAALTNPPRFSITTGLRDLDITLGGGLPVGAVSAIASRPAMGRRSFMCHVALSAARQGGDVLYFSPTRSRSAIGRQCVAALLEVEHACFSDRAMHEVLGEKIMELGTDLGALADLPVYVDDTPALTLTELVDRTLRFCRASSSEEQPAKLIIVDDLECVRFKKMKPEKVLKSVLPMLVEMARSESAHVLIGVPVLRQVEDRPSCRPTLRDLLGEGTIERYCDLIMTLHREGYYRPEIEEPDVADVSILKNSTLEKMGGTVVQFINGHFKDMQ